MYMTVYIHAWLDFLTPNVHLCTNQYMSMHAKCNLKPYKVKQKLKFSFWLGIRKTEPQPMTELQIAGLPLLVY